MEENFRIVLEILAYGPEEANAEQLPICADRGRTHTRPAGVDRRYEKELTCHNDEQQKPFQAIVFVHDYPRLYLLR